MFADLSGYTTLSGELDPEALAAMLTDFWTAVQQGGLASHRESMTLHRRERRTPPPSSPLLRMSVAADATYGVAATTALDRTAQTIRLAAAR